MRIQPFIFCALFIGFTAILLSCKKDKKPLVDNSGTPNPPPVDTIITPPPIPPCDTVFAQNYTYDTLVPSKYLSTYPGSYWNYSDGSSDLCDLWSTVSIYNTTSSGQCVTVNEDRKIAPHTNYATIANESKIVFFQDYRSTIFYQLIDTTIGVFSESHVNSGSGSSAQTNNYVAEVVEKLDSLTVIGGVFYQVLHLKVNSSVVYATTGGGPSSEEHLFYAKNVGLIKRTYSFSGGSPNLKELISYYIAPH